MAPHSSRFTVIFTVMFAVSLVSLAWTGIGVGQELGVAKTSLLPPTTLGPQAKISDVSWLAGEWSGTGLGGECEEWWGRPAGGRMQGAFRYDRDGQLQFTEHFVLAEEGGSLVLRLKHFDREFKGWEPQAESVLFRLVEIREGEARFEGLTYRLVKPDEMHVFVMIGDKEGKQREEKFEFRRSSNSLKR